MVIYFCPGAPFLRAVSEHHHKVPFNLCVRCPLGSPWVYHVCDMGVLGCGCTVRRWTSGSRGSPCLAWLSQPRT